MNSERGNEMNEMSEKNLNDYATERIRTLHDAMAEAGHPITPEEAKFLWVAGQTALAEMVGLDAAPIRPTLERLAADLPTVGDDAAERWREEQRARIR